MPDNRLGPYTIPGGFGVGYNPQTGGYEMAPVTQYQPPQLPQWLQAASQLPIPQTAWLRGLRQLIGGQRGPGAAVVPTLNDPLMMAEPPQLGGWQTGAIEPNPMLRQPPEEVAPPVLQEQPPETPPMLPASERGAPSTLDLSARGYNSTNFGPTQIQYTVRPDYVEINMVRTPPEMQGQGFATEAMRWFLAEADRLGVPVALTPEAVGEGMTTNQLRGFYESLGFSRNRDHAITPSYVRQPNR